MTSDAMKEQREKEFEEVRNSYTIHHGCPWPIPKPLFTMVMQDEGNGNGMVFSLRTRIPQKDVESELNTLLRMNRGSQDDSPILRCDSMVDGVIAFEDEDRAHAFGLMLEDASPDKRVHIAQHDSHTLFREIQVAKSVMVLINNDGMLPQIHQLSSILRAQSEL